MENAVDPVPDADLVSLGLDVYVARCARYPARDDGVDEANDGLFLGARGELLDRQLLDLRACHLDRVDRDILGGVGDDVFRLGADTREPVEALNERVLGGDQGHDVAAGDDVGFVDRSDVERVDDGEHQAVILGADGKNLVLAQKMLGQSRDRVGVDLDVVEVDEREAPLLAEAPSLLFLGDAVDADEHVAERIVLAGLSRLALHLERALEGLVAQRGHLAQYRSDGSRIAPHQRALRHSPAPAPLLTCPVGL